MSKHSLHPRTYVYIDAFNFYYGALKGTPYKWVNFAELFKQLLPRHDIIKIKYFTAKVAARGDDPGQPMRQQLFIRALQTLPNVCIIYGHFLHQTKRLPLASAGEVRQPKEFVEVLTTQEKGSDVNLATHMLFDAVRNLYDVAVLVSNDSDLLAPVRIVKREFGKRIGLVIPGKRSLSRALRPEVDFIRRVRPGLLARSQFPDELCDGNGTFRKPPEWFRPTGG